MTAASHDMSERLGGLSSGARRLLENAVVLKGGARYEALRHFARASEADMIEDLREVVEAGFLSAISGRPNSYDFVDEGVRALVLAEVGEARLAKLRARALAARRRVEGVADA